MERSESIKQLAKALSLFQSQVSGATKSSDNPYFKSKYADLSEIWKTIRPCLADNGLSVSQGGLPCESGYISIETFLMHESGEYISGITTLKLVKDDPQGAGSAITYARRYGLAAILGIHQEDDDGNSHIASQDKNKQDEKHEKAIAEKHGLIKQGIACLANNKIDGFDNSSRVANSCYKHLADEDYTKCRDLPLMDKYVQHLRNKYAEWKTASIGGNADSRIQALIESIKASLITEKDKDTLLATLMADKSVAGISKVESELKIKEAMLHD